MKPLDRILALIVVTCLMSPGWASLVFFRSMPTEGTWAEWQIKGELTSSGVLPKIRLTAGKVIQREHCRYQTLDLSGVWEDDGRPLKLKASYEVDVDALEKNGHPSGAVRLLTAYKEVDGEMQAIKADDPMLAPYELMFCLLSDVRIEPEAVRLSDPEGLRKYEFKLLKAKVNTRHFGGGEAPTSKFEAWISDEVPFGVAKWVMKTRLPTDQIGKPIVVVHTATLIDSGGTASATTKPGD